MTRSLRNQIRYYGEYALLTLGVLVASIFYALFIGNRNNFIYVFQSMCYMMLVLFFLLFPQSFNSIHTQLALSFGDTRRNWFVASLVAKGLYALVSTLVFFFGVFPLGFWLSGSAPVSLQPYLPLFLCAPLFLTSIGGLMGYVSIRFGAKWAVIAFFGFFIVVVAAGMIAMFTNDWTAIQGVLQAPAFALCLLVLCAPVEIISWRLLRRLSVKG